MTLSADARARLAAWVSQRLGAVIDIASVVRPGSGGGWSNDTLIVTLSGRDAQRIVLRTRPDGPAMFRDYDLTREYRVLEALATVRGPPVPAVIAMDEHGETLGRPFFAMQHVEGRVPSDDKPSFAEAGWLFEATTAEQRRFCTGLIRAIGNVHGVDWRALGLGFLRRTDAAALADAMDWLHDLHRWGAGAALHPSIERGFAALRQSVPAAEATCLLWGDARPANVIARDFVPAALLDWELAELGPPELDVAWLLEMNRMRTTESGVAPLPGFLDDDATIKEYQRTTGRPLADLGWYRLFAAVKMAVLMERHLRVAIARGHLRPGHRLLADNVALRRLDALLAQR